MSENITEEAENTLPEEEAQESEALVKPISEGDRFEQELAAHIRGEKVTSLLGEKLDYDEFARDPKKAEALGKEVAALVAEAKRKEDAHLTLKHASSRRGGKKR